MRMIRSMIDKNAPESSLESTVQYEDRVKLKKLKEELENISKKMKT